MNEQFQPPGPAAEYGQNMEYIRDSLFQRHLLKDKIAAAFEAGDFDYYFESLPAAQRPKELLKLSDRMTDEEFCHYARKLWAMNSLETAWDYETLLEAFKSKRASRELLMKEHEREIFDALSHQVCVYRGFKTDGGTLGWSWSLNEEIARRHAVKVSGDDPATVIRGRVPKARILAFFQYGGLNEEEIVVSPEHVTRVERRAALRRAWEDELGRPEWKPFSRN